jgi:hypothetical protein
MRVQATTRRGLVIITRRWLVDVALDETSAVERAPTAPTSGQPARNDSTETDGRLTRPNEGSLVTVTAVDGHGDGRLGFIQGARAHDDAGGVTCNPPAVRTPPEVLASGLAGRAPHALRQARYSRHPPASAVLADEPRHRAATSWTSAG